MEVINSKSNQSFQSDKETTLLQDENSKEPQKKRSLLNRLFGKLDEGSMRGSILSLSILSVGVGCLSLPQRYSQIGIVIYSIEIILTAIITIWSLKMIIEAGRKANLTEYSKVIIFYCGSKVGRLADIVIIIYIFGILVVYQIVIYQMIGAFVFQVSPELNRSHNNDIQDFYDKSIWSKFWFKSTVMIGTSIIVILPLNIQKNISKLRYASFVGIVSLVVIALVLIIQLPEYIVYNLKQPETHINILNFNMNLYFFKATGTLFYAYSCHYGVYPIYQKLKDNSDDRINKVIIRAIVIVSLFFIVVGIVGYLTEPNHTHDLIIKRNNIFEGVDYIMTVCRLLVVLVLFAKIPNNYTAMRISLFNIFIKKNEDEEMSLQTNLLVTVPVTILTAFVGAVYDKIDSILSFLGGFCATIISFIIPVLIYFIANKVKVLSVKGVFVIVLFLFMCGSGLTSACLSFIDFVNGG